MSSAWARPAENARPITRAVVRTTERRAMRMVDSLLGANDWAPSGVRRAAPARKGLRRFAAHLLHGRDARMTSGDGADPRTCLGDPDALHEERVAAAARPGGRGGDGRLRAQARRGRGAVAGRG